MEKNNGDAAKSKKEACEWQKSLQDAVPLSCINNTDAQDHGKSAKLFKAAYLFENLDPRLDFVWEILNFMHVQWRLHLGEEHKDDGISTIELTPERRQAIASQQTTFLSAWYNECTLFDGDKTRSRGCCATMTVNWVLLGLASIYRLCLYSDAYFASEQTKLQEAGALPEGFVVRKLSKRIISSPL